MAIISKHSIAVMLSLTLGMTYTPVLTAESIDAEISQENMESDNTSSNEQADDTEENNEVNSNEESTGNDNTQDVIDTPVALPDDIIIEDATEDEFITVLPDDIFVEDVIDEDITGDDFITALPDEIEIPEGVTEYIEAEAPTDAINVDVEWGEMIFDYDPGVWNPEEHIYEEGEWISNDSNYITITNVGEVSVTCDLSYEQLNKEITAEFIDQATQESLTSEAEFALLSQQSKTLLLQLDGQPNRAMENEAIGMVQLRIYTEAQDNTQGNYSADSYLPADEWIQNSSHVSSGMVSVNVPSTQVKDEAHSANLGKEEDIIEVEEPKEVEEPSEVDEFLTDVVDVTDVRDVVDVLDIE